MLELYQFEECPYSTKVRKKLSEWEIDCILRNVSQDKSKRSLLWKISGQDEVPTLIDSDRDAIIAGDEKRIIQHLETYYARRST
ncbi:MAG TPA: glutathione S-transferase N-terminal domain-containing protein [Nitrospirales bacterium]|nr:glutathione S-transferase N-terminal domain-containing protein [Nitrospirales bacterium]